MLSINTTVRATRHIVNELSPEQKLLRQKSRALFNMHHNKQNRIRLSKKEIQQLRNINKSKSPKSSLKTLRKIVKEKLDDLNTRIGTAHWQTLQKIFPLEGELNSLPPNNKELALLVQDRLNKLESLSARIAIQFNELFVKKSTKPLVVAIEKRLEGYGIKSNFADNIHLAQACLVVVQKTSQRFGETPFDLYATRLLPDRNIAQCVAGRKSENSKIFFNLKSGWTEESRYCNSSEEYSSDDLNHAIFHEIGHALHNKSKFQIQPGLWHGFWGDKTDRKTALDNVSRYSATNTHEFIAETFAGLMSGKNYGKAVMDIYKKYFGPVPKSLRLKA